MEPKTDHPNQANKEQKEPKSKYKVTLHAIERYREKANEPMKPSWEIKPLLIQYITEGKEIIIKNKKDRIRSLLDHDCQPTQYFRFEDWVVVLENGNLIKTVHHGTANRFQEDD